MLNAYAKSQIEMPESYVKLAEKNGERGYSCSEAVLLTYCGNFNLDPEIAVKLASGFGGGMGLMGETCGAVTAAFMVIGLRFGADDITDSYSRQNVLMMVAEFAERFKESLGSLNCRELCKGHSMSSPEGSKALRASGLPQKMITNAVKILEELLIENVEI